MCLGAELWAEGSGLRARGSLGVYLSAFAAIPRACDAPGWFTESSPTDFVSIAAKSPCYHELCFQFCTEPRAI